MKNKLVVPKRTHTFRQWSRKNYAVFSSLKIVIKICVLSAAYSLTNPQESKAQTDTAQTVKHVELEDVEVSGQRAPVVNSQLSRIVTVISKNEVEQAPAQSVDNLLKYTPQVDIRQRGVNGSQSDISIQGGSFDQTLILLNGINLTDPQTGHYNLTLPIDIESIDRIEVLKGPASRVFGTNAFSGAVNFVTGQDTSSYFKLSQIAGEYGTYRTSATLNQHNNKFHNLLSVSKSISSGYMHNTDYDFNNAFYHGKLFIKKSVVALQAGYTGKDLGANSFYSPLYANQHDNTNTYFAAINGETGGRLKVAPVLYWRRNYDHYILDYTRPKFYQNFHFTDVYGAGINTTMQNALGKASLGVDYRREIIYSTSLGLPAAPKAIPGEDSIKYTKSDSRENISIFLEQNIYLKRFSASVGVMANHNTKLSGMNLYPGLDMSYLLTSHFRWYASVNRTLRLPSFTDLYYKGPQNVGNPDLKPEKAWTMESGFKFAGNGVSGNLSYFYRWGRDMIDWVRPRGSQVWHTVNYTKLNTSGVELAMSLKPAQWISAASFIKDLNVSYSFIHQNKNSDTLESYYALDYLKNKIVIGLDHSILKNVGAVWHLVWQDRNGTFADYKRYDPATKTAPLAPYKSFALFDGQVYYSNRLLRVYVEASNIFNESYVDIGNIEQPGRWIRVGAVLKIGI